MFSKIIEIHSEKPVVEKYDPNYGWYYVDEDTFEVDLTYLKNKKLQRKTLEFKRESWEFDKKHGKFL